MSERLPYEEQLNQQWNDLPLPDENMAWADMKRRLDDDDDDGVIAWWRRGCALWGLLVIVLLGLGWWIVRPEKWFTSKTESTTQQTTATPGKTNSGTSSNTPGNKNEEDNTNTRSGGDNDSDQNTSRTANDTTSVTAPNSDATTPRSSSDPVQPGNERSSGNKQPVNETGKTAVTAKPGQPAISHTENSETDINTNRAGTGKRNRNQQSEKPNTVRPGVTTTSARNNNVTPKGDNTGKANNNRNNKPAQPTKPDNSIAGNDNSDNNKNEDRSNERNTPDTATVKKPAVTPGQANTIPADSIGKAVKKDSVKPKQPVARKSDTDSTAKKKNPLFLSAGIAMQQQLPVAGQKATPYSSTGRKGSLADYIPSVYLRLNKKDKWFIQGEFKYGAPQYIKEFTYFQQRTDSAGVVQPRDTLTTNRLKKTFYHQLPLTFNYFVRPNWSVGAGVVWNKFKGAIVDQEVVRRLNQQPQAVLFKGVVAITDSATEFAKSYMQAVFETQYQWRRFTIGGRYSFGLQPYIKYTLPGSGQKEEKNSSIHVFLRYELWKQKKD